MSRIMRLPTICLMLALALSMTIVWAQYFNPDDINPQAYCGIPPYPAHVKPIPPLGPNVKKLGLKLKNLDQHIFFRHGDRSTIAAKCFNNLPNFAERSWTECPNPISNFHAGLADRSNSDGPVDRPNYRIDVQPLPDKNILKGNCHFGQLSQKGALMSVNNGFRYARYLNQTQSGKVTQKNFRTRSTDVHRTRETGQGFMTGVYDQLPSMFPPQKSFSPAKHTPTFYFVDNKVDGLAINDNMCSTTNYLKEAFADPKWLKYQEEVYNPLQKEIAEIVATPNADIYDTFDCTKTLYCHQNALPPGIDERMQQRMEAALMSYYAQSFTYNHTLANILYTGVWAQETIALLTPALDESYSDNIFYINSGHDSNVQAIMNFLQLVGVESKQKLLQWPAYSALLQIELYRASDKNNLESTSTDGDENKGGTVYVRFLYDAEVAVPDFCKNTLLGGELCSASAFITFLSTALPKNGECAGIPRQAVQAFKEAIEGYEHLLEVEAVNGIRAFVSSMDAIHAQQDFVPQTVQGAPLPERSHIENWSMWAGL